MPRGEQRPRRGCPRSAGPRTQCSAHVLTGVFYFYPCTDEATTRAVCACARVWQISTKLDGLLTSMFEKMDADKVPRPAPRARCGGPLSSPHPPTLRPRARAQSRTITKEEAVKFWGKNFAKVNANAMFSEVRPRDRTARLGSALCEARTDSPPAPLATQVDGDKDGELTLPEWKSFWVNVIAHGYTEEEVEEEVKMMMEGGSWVDWNDGLTTASGKD